MLRSSQNSANNKSRYFLPTVCINLYDQYISKAVCNVAEQTWKIANQTTTCTRQIKIEEVKKEINVLNLLKYLLQLTLDEITTTPCSFNDHIKQEFSTGSMPLLILGSCDGPNASTFTTMLRNYVPIPDRDSRDKTYSNPIASSHILNKEIICRPIKSLP